MCVFLDPNLRGGIHILHVVSSPTANIYLLSCCTLTQAQCRHIQAPALADLIQKLHLNKHTPHAVLFGDARYGGLGLPDLYTDQGFGQLKFLVGHLKLADDTGLICISLSHLQIYTGSATPVLSLAFAPYAKWIDSSWLTSVWKYTSQLKIGIDIEDQWTPIVCRLHDALIMDVVLQFNFSPKSLLQINLYRLYLQVLTISDIVSADGITRLPTTAKGEQAPHRVSSLYWPQQQRPPAAAWAQWNLFLSHISTRGQLHQCLGDWVAQPHQQWEWFYGKGLQYVFHYNKPTKTWLEFQPMLPLHPPICTRQTKVWYQMGT